MDKERFSLLQLDPGEIYFEDFSVTFIPAGTSKRTYDSNKQDGRLKMCSKSLVFDPKDITKPILKIPLKDCTVIEQWKGSSKFIDSKNVLAVNSNEYIEMFESNIIAPYIYKGPTNFLFILKYGSIINCLPQICQLHRASTLPAAEQSDMIATIVHSRQARVSFDQLWLDLYEKVVWETKVDKVTPLVINPGRILLSTSRIFFQPYNNVESVSFIMISYQKECNECKNMIITIYESLEKCSNYSMKLLSVFDNKADVVAMVL